MRLRLLLPVALTLVALMYPISSLSQTVDEGAQIGIIPGDIIPDDITPTPVGNVDASGKFDGGFYKKIQDLTQAEHEDGDYGVYDGVRYYDVILVVSRDDGDDRDADEVAQENKDAVVKRLENLGARDIMAAESLSFVTAKIPVADVPGFSLHEEVYGLGDGELPIVLAVDIARRTTHATANDVYDAVETTLNGSGVTVAIVDSGINHPTALNGKVVDRVLCTGTCSPASAESVNDLLGVYSSHGTKVAQVLAASGLANNNGVTPGVDLLDASVGRQLADFTIIITSSDVAHALDWSLKNGADVANVSISFNSLCSVHGNTLFTTGLITEEAVDKGMVVAIAAGNYGYVGGTVRYESIGVTGCSYNAIIVGGIDDRNSPIIMYVDASRGPVGKTKILKPELVAPATNLQLLAYPTSPITHPTNGTSFATPQVSATAAMMLQLQPELTPVEIKSALLLGANWTGPVPCTSSQYERNNPNDNCSYARQPSDYDTANNEASLGILNNVGFGILDTVKSLGYAKAPSPNIIRDYLDGSTTSREYTFSVSNTTEPVKVILTWLVHPHGDIINQTSRNSAAPVANLDFTVACPGLTTIRADSEQQTNEFAVFIPASTGTCTVNVSGSDIDTINKPVQNYALASTLPLTASSSTQNSEPVAQPRTLIVSPGVEKAVRLDAADPDGDPVSFHVSNDPAKGTISTGELITEDVSRVIYTPDADFADSDVFQVTPYDGTDQGSAVQITLSAESLPSGFAEAQPNSDNIYDWDTLPVATRLGNADQVAEFTGHVYEVSAIHLGSVNMEGAEISFTTSTDSTYTASIPASDTRMITFSSPITIKSVVLSADMIDEEALHEINNPDTSNSDESTPDVRVFVGYVPDSCPDAAGAAGAAGSCPAGFSYEAALSPALPIPDNRKSQDTTSTINIPLNGTITSLSVSLDISHTYIGDLLVTLTSPAGTEVTLHNKAGGSSNDIRTTYTPSSNTALASLAGTQMAGDWVLAMGDYYGGDAGTLNSWRMDISYMDSDTDTTAPVESTIFSDDFESGSLAGWTESGEADWRITTSPAQGVPVLPGHSSSNKVLHADNCDTGCTITMTDSIDLSGYTSASLSLWRFMDRYIDADEHLKVEAYDGNRWNTILHWSDTLGSDDGIWHLEEYDLDSYIGTPDFKVRLVTQQSKTNEDVQVDNIVINGTSSSAAGPQEISEEFANLDAWTQTGGRDWFVRAPSPEVPGGTSGNTVAYSASCSNSCIMEMASSLDLSSAKSAQLTLSRYMSSYLDNGEYLKVEIYDGNTWSTAFDWQASAGKDDDTWHDESYMIPTSRLVAGFNVRVTAVSSNSLEIAMVDNIVVSPSAAPPGPPAQQGITEGFDTLDAWNNDGDSNWLIRSPSPAVPGSASGNTVARSSSCNNTCVITLASPLDLSERQSAQLTMSRYVGDGLDYGEYLKVEIYDGSTWRTAFDWQASDREDDNTWHAESYTIPSGYLVSGFDIRITARSSSSSEIVMIDNVAISDGTTEPVTPQAEYSIYASSYSSAKVKRYSPDGTFIDDFVSAREGGIRAPWGIDFGPDGRLYVADSIQNKIMRYDSSGNPDGASNTDATWARTAAAPYGLKWNGNTLYVATYSGVEKFSTSGASAGYHGDAHGSPSSPHVTRLLIPHDVEFGTGKMYVTATYPGKILYYNAATGSYSGTMSTSSQALYYSKGLAWDASGSTSLLASGDDSGRIVRINPSTNSPITSYSSLIDEPYGMDVDSAGVIYVTNKDDNNIVKIDGTTASVLVSGSNAPYSPRDVTLGPAAPAGSGGAVGSGTSDIPANLPPEFGVYYPNGTKTYYIEVAQNSTVSYEIRGTDAEGDPIEYSLEAPDFVSIGSGPVALELDTAGIPPDAYFARITASDPHGNDAYDYVILVTEN